MIKKTSGVKSRTVSIPTYTDGKEYIVSLKPGVDYAAFWTEIETDGSGSTYVPNRAVRIINERPGSKRSCHYVLTDAEVVKLKRDSRVDSVVIPSAHLGFLPRTTAVQAGNFNKPEDDSSSDGNFINYGLVRHNSMDNNYGTTITAPNGYTYTLDGSGVDVVIIDTGIQADHPEFQDADGDSRVEEIDWYNAAGIAGTMPENFYTDIDGHGTHVAGIVAGKTYGWAKNAEIYVMKLNDLSSDQTGIETMEAFDLIIGWHNNKGGDQSRPTVVNMSFGIGGNYYRDSTGDETMIQGGIYRGTPWSGDNLPEDIHPEYGMGDFGTFPFRDNAIDSIIEEMIDAGIHVCIAAGNDGVKIDLPNGPDFNNVFFYDYPISQYIHTFPSLNEGDTFNFSVENWINQTYYWRIDNITTSNADFVTTSGSFVVTAGSGSFSFDTVEDITTEGPREFEIAIFNDSERTELELRTLAITLNDTSLSPYYIVPSITQVSEGGNTIVPNSVTYTITTTDTPNDTNLYWKNIGTTNADDFILNWPTGPSGQVNINSGTASFTLDLKQDRVTEGSQTIIIKLYTDSGFTNLVATAATVTVSDTSVPFISPSNLVKKFVGTSYNDMGQMVIPYNQGSSPYSRRAINVGCLNLTAYNISVDQKVDFSQGGPGVDLYACGTAIYSATSDVNTFALEGYSDAEYFLDSDFRQACISGTSMASPQVCGMSTLMLQLNPAATPEEFKAWLTNLSAGNVGAQLAYFLGNDDYTVLNSLWGGEPRVLYNKFNSNTSLTIQTVIPMLGA